MRCVFRIFETRYVDVEVKADSIAECVRAFRDSVYAEAIEGVDGKLPNTKGTDWDLIGAFDDEND